MRTIQEQQKDIKETEAFLRGWYALQSGFMTRDIDGNKIFYTDNPFDCQLVHNAEKVFFTMPFRLAEVLRLLYCEGVPQDEVARMLGVSKMKVKNLRYIGLLKFRELWESNKQGGI